MMEEIVIKNLGKIFLSVLFFGLILTLNGDFAASNHSINNTTVSHWEGTDLTNTTYTSATSTTSSNININVLIYSGTYAAYSCVNGIKTSLNTANTQNLVPGYTFTYATSTVINSATLSEYDILVMPGGTSGYDYLHCSSIDGDAIKTFVAHGKGYLGICAGAYAACDLVYDYYYGWGLAAHVKCIHANHEGDLTIQITSKGERVLNTSGTITVAHYNGPVMYVSGAAPTFATYADDIINANGQAAIVGDKYGYGRVVLCGPHPELTPQYPSIIADLIVWAANKTTPDPTDVVSISQLCSAAATVKSEYEKNQTLPTSITINNNEISMSQYLYLLAKGIVNLYKGNTSSITVKNANPASAPSGTYTSGIIEKIPYVNHANSLVYYINIYGKAPNYQRTTLGKIPFSKLVYMYSKIVNFYRTHNRLPNYVTM